MRQNITMTSSRAVIAPMKHDVSSLRLPSSTTLSFRTCPIQVTLSDTTIRRLWGVILVVRILSLGQLYMVSSLYVGFKYRSNSFLRFLCTTFLSPSEHDFMNTHALWIGFSYVLIAALFIASLVRMLWEALYHRRLWFADLVNDNTLSNRRFFKSRSIISPLIARLPPVIRRLLDIINAQLWMLWVGYGVRGERFEQGFFMREIMEMVLQTVQAEATSRTISSTFINQSYGALIGISAIMNPLMYRLLANRPSTKRFACVLIEFFIDFVWGVVLPFFMLFPYVHVDRSLTADQIIEQFEIGYYENAQREIRHIVVLSWRAYILSVFPSLSIYSSLQGMTKLLAAARRVSSVKIEKQVAKSERSSTRRQSHELPTPSHIPAGPQSYSRLIHWCHRILMVYGIAIWCISLASTGLFYRGGRIRGTDCRQRLSPWFTSDDACVVVYINCTTLNITGRSEELADVFSTIHTDSLGYLGIFHCPSLEFPVLKAPESFHSVGTISIAHSSIVAWPEEIALITGNFPNLQTLYIAQSKIASPLPPGLVVSSASAWPDSLLRFIALDVDIDELSHAVTTQWRGLSSFYCINCGVKAFPTALFVASGLKNLVIISSELPEIPSPNDTDAHTPIWPELTVIILAYDFHLTSISDSIWHTASSGTTHLMVVVYTNVSEVPAQWQPRLQSPPVLKICGYGSPLCSASSPVSMTSPLAALDCAPFIFSEVHSFN